MLGRPLRVKDMNKVLNCRRTLPRPYVRHTNAERWEAHSVLATYMKAPAVQQLHSTASSGITRRWKTFSIGLVAGQVSFCFCVPCTIVTVCYVHAGTPRVSNSPLAQKAQQAAEFNQHCPVAPVLKLSAELADCPPPVNCCTYRATPQHPI